MDTTQVQDETLNKVSLSGLLDDSRVIGESDTSI